MIKTESKQMSKKEKFIQETVKKFESDMIDAFEFITDIDDIDNMIHMS